jgi:hypothetical protein
MIALVDLHGAAVRVREDDPVSASSMLVLAKDPRPDLLQSRERHFERVDPKTDESATAHAPGVTASNCHQLPARRQLPRSDEFRCYAD